jgi:magnesium transporter
MSSSEHTQGNLTRLREQLESGRMRSAKAMLNSLHPAEIGHLLESLPRHERALVWEILDPDIEGDVLVEVAEAVRDDLIRGMPVEEIVTESFGPTSRPTMALEIRKISSRLPLRKGARFCSASA